MRKNGQLTIFVIIGIVLIIIVGFAIAASKWIEEAQSNSQAQQIIADALYDDALNNYVSGCLDRVTENGVSAILLQGGKLYNTTEQRGPIDYTQLEEGVHFVNFSYYNISLNVTYAILPNFICEDVHLFPPWYPLPDTRLKNEPHWPAIPPQGYACRWTAGSIRFEDGFYGQHNLSRLCSSTGPNVADPDPLRNLQATCSEFYMEIGDEISMQTQLVYYIEQHLPSCTNFSAFNERYGDITIVNNPQAEFIYGEHTVRSTVTYPFFIDVNGRRVSKFYSFQSQLDLRMKELYACAHSIVAKDVQDLFYNKTKDIAITPACSPFIYKEYRNANANSTLTPYDDVIELQDPESLIDGKPLTMLFAIKNRRPALELIRDPTLLVYRTISDIQLLENETIYFDPQGYDPDELSIWYDYSLWKETYVEAFNWTCCQPVGPINCNVNITQCMLYNPYVQPHNWTNSTLFRTTKQNASYKTNHSDVGLHVVNISIWDREGLIDYQEVWVMVFDRPKAIINQTNFFEDVNDSFASIEDPYLLSGNASTKSILLHNGSFSNFLWNDSIEFFFNNTYPSLYLPEQRFSIDPANASYIKDKNFTIIALHSVSLVVVQNTTIGMVPSFPAQTNVSVFACLPHRDAAASWPYNNITWNGLVANLDEFDANHTCCSNDTVSGTYGEYLGVGNPCLLYIEYAQNNMFTLIPGSSSVPINWYGGNPTGGAFFSNPYSNDIYYRNFTRYCSANSGNTCTGIIEEQRHNVGMCNETVGEYGDAETCAGPSTYAPKEQKSQVVCVDYIPGESFQTTFEPKGFKKSNGGSPDGICALYTQCADGTGGNGGTFVAGGVFECQAQCDGNGGCSYPTNCSCETGVDGYGFSCGATEPRCDEQNPGYAWSITGGASGRDEKGCSTACGLVDCASIGRAFNPATATCYAHPTTNSQCDDSFKADAGPIVEGKCVKGNYIESGFSGADGQCEAALGSVGVCDEKLVGACARVGFACSTTCQDTVVQPACI